MAKDGLGLYILRAMTKMSEINADNISTLWIFSRFDIYIMEHIKQFHTEKTYAVYLVYQCKIFILVG